MPSRPHILVVNGRKVREPVFVLGSSYSGADLVGCALKRSHGFHLTIGPDSVRDVTGAFARSPSIRRGRREAAATVLRDAFAQAWQVTPHGCLGCSPLCRAAGQVTGAACCVREQDIIRYGDASPDLIYCAEGLLDAFGDARLIQVVRDGRDVVAAVLADPHLLAWFKPGMANVESEFPNPFFGVETEQDLAVWPGLGAAGKAAMRWRGTVRTMARLRGALSAEQLITLRYETMVADPAAAAATLSEFTGEQVVQLAPPTAQGEGAPDLGPGSWQRLLTPGQLAEIESVAGPDLRRIGY